MHKAGVKENGDNEAKPLIGMFGWGMTVPEATELREGA